MPPLYSLDGVATASVPPSFALYPYGAFTSLVVVDGTALGWRRHEDRLAAATAEMWGHRLDRDRLRDLVRTHVGMQGTPAMSMRITVYPDELSLAAPEAARGCRTLVASTPCSADLPVSETFRVRSVQHRRALPHLKTTDLLAQIAVRRQARLAGFEDALLVAGDEVLEGTTWSVVLWDDQGTVTPADGVLGSVTVAQLEVVAQRLGFSSSARTVHLGDLARSRLVLAVNVHHPARALSQVDHLDLSVDRDLLQAVAAEYRKLERERIWSDAARP